MKKNNDFLASLEQYAYKTAKRSPLSSAWIGVGVVGMALLLSLLNVKNSVAGAQSTRQIVEKASERGDYETAKQYFEVMPVNDNVLGVASELEEKVYPESVVERKIVELESSLVKHPNHFEILLELSRLNWLVGNNEQSSEYREKARILDPNNVIFK